MSSPPQQPNQGHPKPDKPAEEAPAADIKVKPAHGFRSVPRALLVERAQKDKAKAHKLGDKMMRSMGAGDGAAGAGTGAGTGGGAPAGGDGVGGGPSALQRALAEGEREAAERMERLSVSGDNHDDADLVAAQLYKKVVVGAMPLVLAKELSKTERKETKRSETTLIYGEISFPAIAAILEKIRGEYGRPRTVTVPAPDPDGSGEGSTPSSSSTSSSSSFEFAGVMQAPGVDVLVDLGSGAGKPVFAAAALYPFKRVVGVEILESLHRAALEVLERWDAEARPRLAAHHGGDTEVVLLQGDFLDVRGVRDWPAEADVVVANSTCYDDRLMHRIGEAAARMKQGALVVTLTRHLPSPFFHVLFCEAMHMSWGEATVYIQQKMTPPASSYHP